MSGGVSCGGVQILSKATPNWLCAYSLFWAKKKRTKKSFFFHTKEILRKILVGTTCCASIDIWVIMIHYCYSRILRKIVRTSQPITIVFSYKINNWEINLCLEKGQIKIQVRIRPDIFPRFKPENLLLKIARFPDYNLESKLLYFPGLFCQVQT